MDEKIEYNPAWGICKPIRNGCEYEIAKIICKATHNAELKHCEIICNVDCIKYGKAIKEAGYRKESDTARECLEQFICRHVNARLVGVNDDLYYELLEAKDDLLKEKYGVGLGE